MEAENKEQKELEIRNHCFVYFHILSFVSPLNE